MKNILAWGDRLGGIVRTPRLYFAVVPLVIPLIFATIDSSGGPAPREVRASLTPLPSINFDAPRPRPSKLPAHSMVYPIQPGDTLTSVFISGGLTASEAFAVVEEFRKVVDPRRLRLGDLIRFHYDDADRVTGIAMKITGWGSVEAVRTADGFEVTSAEAPQHLEEIVVSAPIESSLYEAVIGAGESPDLAPSLVDVFQWDIDFFALQKGDSFSLVVEKKYSGPDPMGYGPILAARFIHKGEVYEAFRYEQPDGRSGYYSRSGTPLKKQFLRAPLKFTRITSGFSRHRFHPVLKVFRPHHGVDYGAPVGTPVMATADGVVVANTYDRGEGNYVRLRHSSRFETWYLHLSKFAKGIRPGAKVEQGDIIGYVGKTGLATGPHLDYRVKDSGSWLDPLKLKSITPDPLKGTSLSRFRASVRETLPKLDHGVELVASRREAPTTAVETP